MGTLEAETDTVRWAGAAAKLTILTARGELKWIKSEDTSTVQTMQQYEAMFGERHLILTGPSNQEHFVNTKTHQSSSVNVLSRKSLGRFDTDLAWINLEIIEPDGTRFCFPKVHALKTLLQSVQSLFDNDDTPKDVEPFFNALDAAI